MRKIFENHIYIYVLKNEIGVELKKFDINKISRSDRKLPILN